MFYFNWIDEKDDFDQFTHRQQDIKIFDLIISEQETVYPTAIITVEATQSLWDELHNNTWAVIVYDDGHQVQQLFKGYINSFPIKFSGTVAKVELVAKPSNVSQQVQALKDKLIQDHDYDLMLYSQLYDLNQADISDLLAQCCKLVDWDRIDNKVKLISYQPNQASIKFINKHFTNSLDINMHRLPLDSIDLKVNINWTQAFCGETCLDPILQHYFEDGILSTLTANDLKRRWWQNFDRIGNSGYIVKYSKLEEIKPAFIRAQARTKPILVSNKDPLLISNGYKTSKRIRLKKFYFRPSLTLSWHYCQPRSEQLIFQVRQELKGLNVKRGQSKHLVINLPEPFESQNRIDWAPELFFKRGDYCINHQINYLCLKTHYAGDQFIGDQVYWIKIKSSESIMINKQIGVFFSSDRGHRVIEQIKTRAKVMLDASRRCVDIKFTCNFKEALNLSTRDTIELFDDQLPQGCVTGKVKKLILHASGETGQFLAHVTISCSIEIFDNDFSDTKNENELFEYNLINQSHLSNISNEDKELDAFLFPQFLGAQDLLKHVDVINDANIQEKELISNQFPFGHNLDYILNRNLTRVKLELEDLRTLPRLKRDIILPAIYLTCQNS